MRPRRAEGDASDDLFRARLSNQLDPKHPLIRLAGLIDWESCETEFGALYHEVLGRPGKPTRLMVGLTYLKHSCNLSDEQSCEHWLENPLHQAEQVLLAAAPLIMAKTGTLSIAESPLNLISGQASPEPKSLMQAESSTGTGSIYWGGRRRPSHGFSRSRFVSVIERCLL
jgi:hypothetical protein